MSKIPSDLEVLLRVGGARGIPRCSRGRGDGVAVRSELVVVPMAIWTNDDLGKGLAVRE